MVGMTHDDGGARRTPWHLWVAGVLALLFEGFGCYQYLMTNLDGANYIRASGEGMGWTAAQAEVYIRYLEALPAWLTAVWAIGVWSGLLAAGLLLAKRRLAVTMFAISLLAFVVNQAGLTLSTDVPDFVRSEFVPALVIFVICLLLLVYAWAMARRGLLR